MIDVALHRGMSTQDWSPASVSRVADGEPPPAAAVRGRVLVIEAGRAEADTCTRALRALHLECTWMRRGMEGLAAARSAPFDLCMVDADLPDMSGIDVVRTLRAERDLHLIILRGSAAMAAVRMGGTNGAAASDLEKPFRSTDVIAIVNSVLGSSGARGRAARALDHDHACGGTTPISSTLPVSGAPISARSVAERWAYFVLRTIDEDTDPKTITIWAKAVGVSRSVLSECCRLVHVPAHDARDFARLLRAVCRSGKDWQPEAVLDLADARTLKKLLARGGFSVHTTRTPNVPEFLKQQQWVCEGNPGLEALHALLFDPARYAGG